ncbi:hypothetical protein GCM10009757_48130 [Streptomyces cheonanensis]|uniref:Uncharacterized protein n=1 Tax=Streptomyces cheonanensis TaxID=312720 RepID=A0ABP5H4T3_9ACTN
MPPGWAEAHSASAMSAISALAEVAGRMLASRRNRFMAGFLGSDGRYADVAVRGRWRRRHRRTDSLNGLYPVSQRGR